MSREAPKTRSQNAAGEDSVQFGLIDFSDDSDLTIIHRNSGCGVCNRLLALNIASPVVTFRSAKNNDARACWGAETEMRRIDRRNRKLNSDGQSADDGTNPSTKTGAELRERKTRPATRTGFSFHERHTLASAVIGSRLFDEP